MEGTDEKENVEAQNKEEAVQPVMPAVAADADLSATVGAKQGDKI